MTEHTPTDDDACVHSDETILADIRRVGDLVGEMPTLVQYHEHGTHSKTTVRRRFGKWVDSLDAAGYDTSNRRKPHYRSLLAAAGGD